MTWLMAPIRQVTRGSPHNCSRLLLDRLCCCPRGPCSYGRTRHPAIHGQLAHTAARVMTPCGPCSYGRTRHPASYGQLAHTAARVTTPCGPCPYGRTRHPASYGQLAHTAARVILALPVLATRKWPGRLGGAQLLHMPHARPGVCCIALSLPQEGARYRRSLPWKGEAGQRPGRGRG